MMVAEHTWETLGWDMQWNSAGVWHVIEALNMCSVMYSEWQKLIPTLVLNCNRHQQVNTILKVMRPKSTKFSSVVRVSAVYERTVGKTCNQNEQHQVGQDNIRMDTQRRKRVRGRPKRKWRDNIEEVGNSQWMRVAKNRSAWRECGGDLPAVAWMDETMTMSPRKQLKDMLLNCCVLKLCHCDCTL